MSTKDVVLSERKGVSNIVVVLLIAVSCILGAGVGYWFKAVNNGEVVSQIDSLNSKFSDLKKQLDQTKQILAEKDSQLANATTEKSTLLAEIKQLKVKLSEPPAVVIQEVQQASSKEVVEEPGRVEKVSTVVYFDFNKAELKPEYLKELGSVAHLIIRKNAALVIEGHTDDVGDKEYNIILSKKRADVVKQAILTLTADKKPCNIISIGVGSAKNKPNVKNNEKRKVLVTAVEDCKGSL